MPYKIVIEHDDGSTLKQIAAAKGIDFSRGEGFYELVKKEKVSAAKNLVLWSNGKLVSDDPTLVRTRCGLRPNVENMIQPSNVPANHKLFVQSTSATRKIPEDAAVLFVVDIEEDDVEEAEDEQDEEEEGDIHLNKRAKPASEEWCIQFDAIVDFFHDAVESDPKEIDDDELCEFCQNPIGTIFSDVDCAVS
jgi:hypothetical protein